VYGCGGGETEVVENEAALAARVGDWTLTKEFLYDFISKLPDAQKKKYDTPGGRAVLAGEFLDEELFYLQAQSDDLAAKPEVKKQIEEATRRILIQAFYKDNVDANARPSEKEMKDHYDAHLDVYTTLPVVRAQHIFSKNEEKLIDLRARIEEGGEKMTTMAHKYSEDKITQSDGGDLGFFNPGGYIRGVGYSEVFSDTVFQMEPKILYGPVKWEKGYSLIRVNEIRPAKVKSFGEVMNEISGQLTKTRIDQVKNEVASELRQDYDWRNYMEETYRQVQRSPEELFEYAQNTTDPYARIKAFEEILEKFPDDEHAPQAMFMIGFVYIEELTDKVSAGRYFTRLIDNYPDSEVAESARWMLENLDQPLPDFEDIDELNKKLSGDSD
jgi:peptidyl-prolyl cis-trans isomerase C